MLEKKKRIVDEVCLERFRVLPCVACRHRQPSDPAHLTSVGAGGDDVPGNLMSLCRRDHAEQHSLGWPEFAKKWPRVKLVLEGMKRTDISEPK